MGKLKRSRNNRKARLNPLGDRKPSGKDETKDDVTRKSKIVPLINNLKSSVANEKSMALGALTVICEDQRMRKICLKEKLVPAIIEQCLRDENDEIVVEALGLLRNLAIEEGYDIITYLWRQDIWAMLESGLARVATSFKYLAEDKVPADANTVGLAKKVDDKAKVQLLYDFTENIISMVVVLASGSEDLYDQVLSRIDPILALVLELLQWNTPLVRTSLKLHNTLLDFLYEFSTELRAFLEKLSQSDVFQSLQLLFGSEKNRLGRGYIEGITYQIYETSAIEVAEDTVSQRPVRDRLEGIVNIMRGIDLVQLRQSLGATDNATHPLQASEQKPSLDKPENIDQQISGDTPQKVQAKDDLQLLEMAIDVFTSAWEFLANGPVERTLTDEVVEIITKTIYPSLVELLKFDTANKSVLQLTDKILVCFNNMAWLMVTRESIPSVWFELSLQLWDVVVALSRQLESLETQKNCLNVCWAVAKAVGPAVSPLITTEMVDELVAKCMAQEQSLHSLEFILAALGLLGTAAPRLSNVAVIKSISDFILSLMDGFTSSDFVANAQIDSEQRSNANEIVVESLDLFFDLFADAEFAYDLPIFVEGGYLSKLRKLEPQVKEMYKRIDKKKEPHVKATAEDAWQNLTRFIQYKESERR